MKFVFHKHRKNFQVDQKLYVTFFKISQQSKIWSRNYFYYFLLKISIMDMLILEFMETIQ